MSSFFGRSSPASNPPPNQYHRVPDGLHAGLRPNARPPPPQAAQYNDPSQALFEKRSYDRKPPPPRSGMTYAPTSPYYQSIINDASQLRRRGYAERDTCPQKLPHRPSVRLSQRRTRHHKRKIPCHDLVRFYPSLLLPLTLSIAMIRPRQ